MFNFHIKVQQGEDAQTGCAVFGFVHEDCFVHDPTRSECGRFEVDPHQAYGVSARDAQQLTLLNQVLRDATDDAIAAGGTRVHALLARHLSMAEVGQRVDEAARFWEQEQGRPHIAKAFADYIQHALL